MANWVTRIFKQPTLMEILVEQREACRTALAKHEQAVNYSTALSIYNRAEVARLKGCITELMTEEQEKNAS